MITSFEHGVEDVATNHHYPLGPGVREMGCADVPQITQSHMFVLCHVSWMRVVLGEMLVA